MAWFNKEKEPEVTQEEPSNKLVIGVNPELVDKVRIKVSKLREEKEILRKDYFELMKKMETVQSKCDVIESTFKNFRTEMINEFMQEARKELKKEIKSLNDSISNNHSRILKQENELIKLNKSVDEQEFANSFQDYYQLIKFCIYIMSNTEAENQDFIIIILQTVHSLIDDMRRNKFWDAGKDAVITSLLNLKTYWRSKDERIEQLIGSEIDALEKMR